MTKPVEPAHFVAFDDGAESKVFGFLPFADGRRVVTPIQVSRSGNRNFPESSRPFPGENDGLVPVW